MLRRASAVAVALIALAGTVLAQSNRIDIVTPSAPELAPYGKYAIGVRTIQATDKNRPDILATKEGGPTARYDRTLTLEVWYPAALAAGQKAGGDYHAITRDPAITATLHGQAVRDAAPLTSEAPFPLVIISHGYPGNRYLMSHLAENLASKGFVTVSIDHKDSTYDDQKPFASTLYNRAFDDLFVLNEMDRLGKPGSGSFLGGRLDAEPDRPGRLLDGRLRRRQRRRRRLQQGERDDQRRAAEQAARRSRRRQSRVPQDDGSAHQGGDRDRAVGHGRRILGRGGLERGRDPGPVRRRAARTMWRDTRRGRRRSTRAR